MTPILVTGDYGNDPTKGKGLGDWIKAQWKLHYGLDIITSVYDRDVLSLIPSTGPVPTLIGFSWGFSKVVQVCYALLARGQIVPRVISIDGVPRSSLGSVGHPLPDPRPAFIGFDLPSNVLSAYCIWRGYDNQRSLYSGPIRSAKCPFLNQKYNPTPGQPNEASEHGEYCRVPAAKLVVDWVRAA